MTNTDPRQRFSARQRIRHGSDFRRAYGRKVRASEGALLVYGCENGLEHSRLGLSVSRKVGNAVARNRWKRLTREAFRLSQSELPAGIDLVIVPRAAEPPPLAALRGQLVRAARALERKLRKPSP